MSVTEKSWTSPDWDAAADMFGEYWHGKLTIIHRPDGFRWHFQSAPCGDETIREFSVTGAPFSCLQEAVFSASAVGIKFGENYD